jgi:hypothetical protein
MILLPVLGGIALLLSAATAFAAPNVPNGAPINGDFPAGELCPFPVRFEGSTTQLVPRTLPNGVQLLTGPGVLTVTNIDPDSDGRSATYNISGPVRTTDTETVLTGTSVVLLLNSQAPPGPGLIATKGRGVIDNNNDFQLDTFKGRTEDVCQKLA